METRLINPHECQCIQSRVVLDDATVAKYAEMMAAGIAFDPCKGIQSDPDLPILIYDGNHRVEAAKQNGSMVEVEIKQGTAQDAEWLAFGANARHGLPRSAGDIAKAIKAALGHPNALGKSDREIARHCGCDHKTVGKYRKEMEASGERPRMDTRTVQRSGTEYQMAIPEPVAEKDVQAEAEKLREVHQRLGLIPAEKKPLPDYDVIKITTAEGTLKITAPAYHPDDKVNNELADGDSVETCWFCGDDFDISDLYKDPEALIASAPFICRSCASKAMHELLDPSDPDVIREAKQDEELVLNEIDMFKFYHADREKIVYAGLRLISPRGEFGKHQLHEMLPKKNGDPGFTWQKIEEFPSKAALVRRIKELEDESNVIIERHL